MEGRLSQGSGGVTALVAREFAPSRIEHQLLAQVCELVCGPRGVGDESRLAERSVSEADDRGGDDGAPVAGRRVA
jgi:hypothetical protein